MRQGPVERALVGSRELEEAGFEGIGDAPEERPPPRRRVPGVAALPRARLGCEQVQHHGGHERPREEVAGEHREDDGHRQRREQRPAYSGEEQDRHEDDTDRQGRDERRRRDLRRSVEDGLPQRLAQVQLAVIVLDFDRRVVHEDADGQRQPTQRHHVEGLVQDLEHDDRGQDRQRDRCDDDQCAPPGAKEQQDHQPRQATGDQSFVDHPGDGRPDEDALVEQEVHLEARRQARQDLRHQLARLAHDRQGRGAAVAQDGQQGRVAPVAPHQVRLGIEPVVHERDISDVHRGPIHVADGDLVQVIQDLRAAVDRDVVLAHPDLRRAGGQDDVLSQDRVAHVLR